MAGKIQYFIYAMLLTSGKCYSFWTTGPPPTATAGPDAQSTHGAPCQQSQTNPTEYYGSPSTTYITHKYYTTRIGTPTTETNVSSAATNSEDFNFSEPPGVCKNCIIYSIKGNIMGIMEEVVMKADPFQPEIKCKFSLSEVQGIVSNFQDMINGVAHTPSNAPSTNEDQCQKALQDINRLTTDLVIYSLGIKNSKGVSADEYLKMTNNYDAKIERLNQLMEFVRRQANQEAKGEVDKAQKAIDQMQNKYNIVLEENENLRDIVNMQKFKLAISHIRDGKIDAAKANFYQLVDPDNSLSGIINEAYGVDKIDNILLFADRLSSNWEKARVCVYLVENMKSDLNTPLVLVVDLYVKTIRNEDDLLEDTRKMLKEGVADVLNSFGSQMVTNSNHEAMRSFDEKRSGILENYITPLVKAAYSRAIGGGQAEEGASKILDFTERLYDDDARRSEVGKALYAEMKDNGKFHLSALLRIAYREFKVHQRNSATFSHMPREIQAIVSGDRVAMEFRIDEDYTPDRLNVVASPPMPMWTFETTNGGKTFYIVANSNSNRKWSYMMYAAHATHAASDSERRVFVYAKPDHRDSQGEWEIRDENWENRRYLIFNKEYKEYLNVCSHRPINRFFIPYGAAPALCTWRNNGKGPNPIWAIFGY